MLRKSHQIGGEPQKLIRGGRWGDILGQTGRKPTPCVCVLHTVVVPMCCHTASAP